MSEILDRVAGALRDACPIGDRMHPDVARHMARAAINAMREPTQEMDIAGAETMPAAEAYDMPDDFKNAWQAAIDAALTDGK